MYSDRRGTDKNHPGQNLPDKRPSDKTPEQKPPRTIERDFEHGAIVRVFFVLGLLKIGGPRCVTYFWGSRDVWQSVTGRGQHWPKIAWRTLWTAS